MMSPQIRRCVVPLLTALGLLLSATPTGFAAAPKTSLLAYRQGSNVFLATEQGSAPHALTTDGSGYNGIFYPWFQWSPDGKYLLLVRVDGTRHVAANVDLVLRTADASVSRTLVSGVVLPSFFPSWALDGNRIVYVSAQRFANGVLHNTVSSIDVAGHSTVLWRYDSRPGCGGATPVPAEEMRWTEVGPLGVQRSMQWSMARHLAVYSATCSSGLNLTDTATGRTQRLDPQSMAWSSAALSPQGRLAVTNTSPVTGLQQVLLTTPRAGAAYRIVAPGELPSWSPDGQALYFVQRTTIGALTFTDPQTGPYAAKVYASAVWRAHGDGSGPALVLTQDAYALGPLQIQVGEHIIYSRVDNMTTLSYHLLPGHTYTTALFRQYGPRVGIRQYVSGSAPFIVLHRGGNPAVQP